MVNMKMEFRLTGLGGVGSVAQLSTANEQPQSNRGCCFYSSIALFASGRSFLQNIFISTVAGVKCSVAAAKSLSDLTWSISLTW